MRARWPYILSGSGAECSGLIRAACLRTIFERLTVRPKPVHAAIPVRVQRQFHCQNGSQVALAWANFEEPGSAKKTLRLLQVEEVFDVLHEPCGTLPRKSVFL